VPFGADIESQAYSLRPKVPEPLQYFFGAVERGAPDHHPCYACVQQHLNRSGAARAATHLEVHQSE
jgi:hypothetical protein